MEVVIPLWFYEFGATMYLFAAIIGVLLTYFAHKIFSMTRHDHHRLLFASFTLLTIGFGILAFTNWHSFAYFNDCVPNCSLPEGFGSLWNSTGNNIYYALSMASYIFSQSKMG